MAKRLQAMGQPNYEHGFQVALHERTLDLPLGWKKPQVVFVNSMSDLFHAKIPDSYIRRVFDVMKRASWHTFQVLTKRAERLESLAAKLDWPTSRDGEAGLCPAEPERGKVWKPSQGFHINVWMGVSVETPEYLYRMDHLRRTPARVRFISFEPLLAALGKLDLDGIHWAIVGGESGPKSRPMNEAWVTEIRDQCRAARVPFFFKQWGGTNKKKAGRLLDGRVWDEMPCASSSPPPRPRRGLPIAPVGAPPPACCTRGAT